MRTGGYPFQKSHGQTHMRNIADFTAGVIAVSNLLLAQQAEIKDLRQRIEQLEALLAGGSK